jgi:retinal rod rhodopsin-sensitive cGMP 3',5'-cyclic phosphodiesterase subunit delta
MTGSPLAWSDIRAGPARLRFSNIRAMAVKAVSHVCLRASSCQTRNPSAIASNGFRQISMAELIEVASDPKARAIVDGFRLIRLTLKNAATGQPAWTSEDWIGDVFTTVKQAHLPAAMLTFPAVGREIVFSTVQPIREFRIEQQDLLLGNAIEQWNYTFGLVIPNSENSWETIVEAAGEGRMLPASLLSGNMFIVTSFYSGQLFISRSVVKVFYE